MQGGAIGDLLVVLSLEPSQGGVEVAELDVVEVIHAVATAVATVCCISYWEAVGQGFGDLKITHGEGRLVTCMA